MEINFFTREPFKINVKERSHALTKGERLLILISGIAGLALLGIGSIFTFFGASYLLRKRAFKKIMRLHKWEKTEQNKAKPTEVEKTNPIKTSSSKPKAIDQNNVAIPAKNPIKSLAEKKANIKKTPALTPTQASTSITSLPNNKESLDPMIKKIMDVIEELKPIEEIASIEKIAFSFHSNKKFIESIPMYDGQIITAENQNIQETFINLIKCCFEHAKQLGISDQMDTQIKWDVIVKDTKGMFHGVIGYEAISSQSEAITGCKANDFYRNVNPNNKDKLIETISKKMKDLSDYIKPLSTSNTSNEIPLNHSLETSNPDAVNPQESAPSKIEPPSSPLLANVRVLPKPPEGVIKNGYGEYLVYRITPEGKSEAITESEYEHIFDLIEERRSLILEDRHADLKTKIQEKLGKDIHVLFIPRTLHDLIFLRECIQEDIDKKQCSHAHETGILFALHSIQNITDEAKKKIIEKSMKQGFWQQCLFKDEDYENGFIPTHAVDYRQAHLRRVAARFNEVALNFFKSKNEFKGDEKGLTYQEIEHIQDKILSYFQELHTPDSSLHQATQEVQGMTYLGVARAFAEEHTKVWGKVDPFPLGIVEERHEQIVKKAIQLECSAEAINHFILYRGADLALDSLTRKKYTYSKDSAVLANSSSYALSLFAGALYDGGAVAFHYMRKSYLDAQAVCVPLKKQKEGKTPFHAYLTHPLTQLMSRGEYFHGRTKVWKLNPEDKVLGFFGVGTRKFSKINACCKTDMTKEEMEKRYQKYKNKTYLLAPKSVTT